MLFIAEERLPGPLVVQLEYLGHLLVTLFLVVEHLDSYHLRLMHQDQFAFLLE
jgi:hypothetical protein